MAEDKRLVLRMDEELYYKLKFISETEYRSTNSQIIHWVREWIEEFENKYGEIWL